MTDYRKARKTFVRQHDAADCGVACLRSILRFYSQDAPTAALRQYSGTDKRGVTLLGLIEAASWAGLRAEGCQADIGSLVQHADPTILHVATYGNAGHFVVWYGLKMPNTSTQTRRHLIGDPASGLIWLTDTELSKIWISGKCLTIAPVKKMSNPKVYRHGRFDGLLKYVREDLQMLSIASLIGIFTAALGLTMAVFTQKLFDDILPSGDRTKLLVGIGLITILLLTKTMLEAVRSYLLLAQARDFSEKLAPGFLNSLLQAPMSFFDRRTVGDIISRMSDTARIQKTVTYVAGQSIIDILAVFVSIACLIYYSLPVALICMTLVPGSILIVFLFKKNIKKAQREVMAYHSINETNLVDLLGGIKTVKYLNRERFFSYSYKETFKQLQQSIFNLGKTQLMLNVSTAIFNTTIVVSVIGIGALLTLDGDLGAGKLMAVVTICASLIPASANLASLMLTISDAEISFDRISELTDMPPEDQAIHAKNVTEPIQKITMEAVSFRFPGRNEIISCASLEVAKGEIVGLVGESGSGKTTILNLLAQSYKPTSGVILVNGNALGLIPVKTWRSVISYIPQDIQIFNGTVEDNILLGDQGLNMELDAVLQLDYYSRFLNSLPYGLKTQIGEEGINLSGGQKQWVGIIRALIRKPQVILLDEITSAMDVLNEREVVSLLTMLKRDSYIIYVSHRVETLRTLSDRIYELKGKVVTLGKSSLDQDLPTGLGWGSRSVH